MSGDWWAASPAWQKDPEPAREELPHEHDCAYGPGGYHRFQCWGTACVHRLFLDCPDRKDHP